MEITEYSRVHFNRGLANWEVPKDYADTVGNYFLYGFSPGSFFTAVLANDMASAMICSHPNDSVISLKNLFGWLWSTGTYNLAWGNYGAVEGWLSMDDATRRTALESKRLVYTESQEILMALNGDDTGTPVFFMS